MDKKGDVAIILATHEFETLRKTVNNISSLEIESLTNALDGVFNGYLWSEHSQGSDNFREAQSYHMDFITIKKLLNVLKDPINEALKNNYNEE